MKKDSGRRWSNVLHNGGVERKTSRMKTRKNQSMHQEEDTSNEGDTAVSYDGKFFFLSKFKVIIILFFFV